MSNDPSPSTRGAASPTEAASRTDLIGEILWTCHRVSLVCNRAILLTGNEAFTRNNEIATVIEVYLRGKVRPRDLVPLLDLTRGGVTNLLDRLEGQGAIRRSTTTDADSRGVDVTLTPEGRAAVERIAEAFEFAIEVSEPLLHELASLCTSAGFDLDTYRPRSNRKPTEAVQAMRALAAAVLPVWSAYRIGFGSDTPRPGATFELLWLIRQSEGVRPSDLSETTGLSPSSTTELLDRLEVQGCVARSRSEQDGRRVHVTLTPVGLSRLETAIVHAEPAARGFAAVLFDA